MLLSSIFTNPPSWHGSPLGALSRVERAWVSAMRTVRAVALSNRNHTARYPAGALAKSASTDALRNVNTPASSNDGSAIGLTAVR